MTHAQREWSGPRACYLRGMAEADPVTAGAERERVDTSSLRGAPAGPSTAARFAWPAAFVIGLAMVLLFVREQRTPEPKASEVMVAHPTPVLVKELREVARLETLTVHVEKVVDMKDRQRRMYGLVAAEDALLFVASGEVVLGVDLQKLGDDDARFDEATKTAYLHLPRPEIFSTRFDEAHSYVHTRDTDVLAKRNEGLEAAARREALASFAAAGSEKQTIERAREQAEKELRALARAWGAKDVVFTWAPTTNAGDPAGERALTTP